MRQADATLIDDIFHYLLEYSKVGEHRHELTITDFDQPWSPGGYNIRIDIGNYLVIMMHADDLIIKFNIGWIITFNYESPLDKRHSECIIDLVNPESIPNMVTWIDDQIGDYEIRLELVEWENALGIEPSCAATLAERIAVIAPLAPTSPLAHNI